MAIHAAFVAEFPVTPSGAPKCCLGDSILRLDLIRECLSKSCQRPRGRQGLVARERGGACSSIANELGQCTQPDPIGLAGGLNLYGYANGDPINFSDPFGLCPPEVTNRPCPSGFVSVRGRAEGNVAGTLLLTAAMEIAEQTDKHVSIHGGRRGHNPSGSNNESEHRMDLGGSGAFDFHLFNEDGSQVPDGDAVKLIMKTGGMPDGTRLIHHLKGTNTEGEHLHMDSRTDIGARTEKGGVYRPMRQP